MSHQSFRVSADHDSVWTLEFRFKLQASRSSLQWPLEIVNNEYIKVVVIEENGRSVQYSSITATMV